MFTNFEDFLNENALNELRALKPEKKVPIKTAVTSEMTLQKAVKAIIMPGKPEISGDRATWGKKGGHTGDKAINAMRSRLLDAKWKHVKSDSKDVPDGSVVGDAEHYIDPTKSFMTVLHKRYGNTPSDNYFSIVLKKLK